MSTEAMRRSVRERYSSTHDIEVYRKRSSEGLRHWETAVVDRFFPASQNRVLVVGCGGGRESFALDALGFSVTGIDIVSEQVESARETSRRLGHDVRFEHYDGACIPFDDGSYSAATLWSQVLGNVPGSDGRVELLRECCRVLVAGGVLSLSVHDRARTMRRLIEEGDRYETVRDGQPGDIMIEQVGEKACYWHYFTKDEIIRQCDAAGLEVLEVTTSDKLGVSWDNLIIVVCTRSRRTWH